MSQVRKAERLEDWKAPSSGAVLGWLRSLAESKETHTRLLLFTVIAVIITPSLTALNYCCCCCCCCLLRHDVNVAATAAAVLAACCCYYLVAVGDAASPWIFTVLWIYTEES